MATFNKMIIIHNNYILTLKVNVFNVKTVRIDPEGGVAGNVSSKLYASACAHNFLQQRTEKIERALNVFKWKFYELNLKLELTVNVILILPYFLSAFRYDD